MIFKFLNRLTALLTFQAASSYREIANAPRYQDPRRLASHELRIYSQNGEDGIIQYLLDTLSLPMIGKFLEIGCGNGSENNTRALLSLGWSGTWIEGSPRLVRSMRKRFAETIRGGQLVAVNALALPETIEDLIARHSNGEVHLLSIDVDRDTHHLWRAISSIHPAIAIIEYNAFWRPPIRWETPYVPGKAWDGQSAEFGASLQTLEDIGNEKGYRLVGCDLTGTNAFFVRADMLKPECFTAPFNAANHYELPRQMLLPPGAPRWR